MIEADVTDVDLSARKLRCVHGLERGELEFEFDHLLLALGSETNFFDNAGIRDWAVTMKNLSDAALPGFELAVPPRLAKLAVDE